ncbi:MAG TPA: SDR family NAD(P)-dependent oxidoreductase, partial [Acidimicrobiales bacterium]
MTSRTMQRIVVSGANRGIGLGFVRVYVERGDQVFACCRRPREAGLLGEIARQRPDQCTVVGMDVTSKSQVLAAVEQVSRQTNGVDVLINNAGVFFPSTGLADIDPGELLESMAVNAVGPMRVTQAFLA